MFADLFDPVIQERHNGYNPRTMKHTTDLDATKVQKLDSAAARGVLPWALGVGPCQHQGHPMNTLWLLSVPDKVWPV